MLSLGSVAQETDNSMGLWDAVSNGNLMLQLRPRYNYIVEDEKPLATNVATIRTLLGWRTAPFHDFRLTAQGIHTDHIGAKRTNDDVDQYFSSPYPLLPDPPTTDINQLYVDYTGLPATRVRAGRQVIKLDNDRFISDNDFRQIPQVFSGVTVVNNSLEGTEFYLGHLARIRNFEGEEYPLRMEILHVAYNPVPDHRLGAYGYFHDQVETGAYTGFENNSNKVIGARADGAFSVSDVAKLLYTAEFAKQKNYANGDSRINANYVRLGGGLWWSKFGFRMDYEIKGSNNGAYGFQTPLTDFYAFNGTALQFTSTPVQGLRDVWLTMRGEVAKFGLFTEFHQYRSDNGGFNFGRELDLSVSYPLLSNLIVKLQHANYQPGDAIFSDGTVKKYWLAFTYNY
ncbi:MAG: alginate export family protein [Burkholderiales bacterium]